MLTSKRLKHIFKNPNKMPPGYSLETRQNFDSRRSQTEAGHKIKMRLLGRFPVDPEIYILTLQGVLIRPYCMAHT